MKKIVSFVKEKKTYFLSFFIPFLLLILLFLVLRAIGSEKYIALLSDEMAQYFSLFHYLKEILMGSHSIFYSFSNGLGGNLFGIFGYYLISPFNLLVLFFRDTNFHFALFLIGILKISLSGFTMFYYLKKHYPTKKDVYLLVFSTSYALMSYNICYYFNILWLDSLYLLPLMCYGIDSLIEKKKISLYVFSLILSILCNYYIGYMLCIFSFLYFFYTLFKKYSWKEKKNEMLEAMIRYGITSLLIGFSCMVIIIPSLMNVLNSSKSVSESYQKSIYFESLFELFGRGYIGSQDYENILCHGGPMIYTGIIHLILLFLYFLNKKITKKEKILSFIIIFIFLISFDVNYLNYVWHGFNEPVGFDHRFAFLFNFFVLTLSAQSFFNKDGNSKLHYFLIAPILPIFSIGMLFQDFDYIGMESIYISVGFYLFYLIFLYAFHLIKNKKQEKLLSYLLLLIVSCELFFNGYWCLRNYYFPLQLENYSTMTTINQKINEIKPKENEFYRIEKDFSYTSLDGFLFSYYGTSSFISTIPKSVIQFWNHVGYGDYINMTVYTSGFPPILDSILGIKYFVYSIHDFEYGKEVDHFSYSKYNGYLFGAIDTEYKIYENPYALNLGFMISDYSYSYNTVDTDNLPALTNQILIWATMTDSDTLALTSEEIEKSSKNKFTFTIKEDKDVYFDFLLNDKSDKTKQIYINGELKYQYTDDTFTGFHLNSDEYKVGDTVTVEFKFEEEMEVTNFLIYYFDQSLFEKQVNDLKQNELEIETIQDGYIKGTVVATEEKPILFLSIPNEDGWVLKVDGKETKIDTIYDTFMGVELTPGTHDIELTFHVPGLKLGIFVSTISIFLLILFLRFQNQVVEFINNLYWDHEEVWNYLIVGVLTTLVNVLSYHIFSNILSIHYMVSTVIAWILSVLFAYITNKHFVFHTHVNTKKELIKECFEFFEFRILSLLMELLFMYVLVSCIHFDDMISKIVVNILVIIVNYFFSKLIIFKKGGK